MNGHDSKSKLPPYVIIKGGKWIVRREFPTAKRWPNGKIKYIPIHRTCEIQTPEYAAMLARELEREYKAAHIITTSAVPLSEYLTTYLQAKKDSVSLRTYERFEDDIKRHITSKPLSAMRLDEIKTMHIQKHFISLNRSSSVIRKLYKSLSAAFNQAIKWELIVKNPCHGVVLPKLARPEIRVFDTTQAKAFIAECRKTENHIVFELALETGARPSEYLALRWEDIDFNTNTIRIRRSVKQGLRGGGFEFGELKTARSEREIQFSENLMARLFTHREIQNEYLKKLRKRARSGRKDERKPAKEKLANFAKYDLVFPSETGAPQAINNLNRREFKELVVKIKLDPKEFTLYSLRHSAATLSLAAGVNIKAVAEKLGHTGVEMLLTAYSHVLPNMRKEASDKLAAVIY